MLRTTTLLLMFNALLLAGCAGVPVERYADNRPALVLEDYFAGQTTAWGIFQDRSGEVIRRFRVGEVTLFFRKEG